MMHMTNWIVYHKIHNYCIIIMLIFLLVNDALFFACSSSHSKIKIQDWSQNSTVDTIITFWLQKCMWWSCIYKAYFVIVLIRMSK